MNSTFPLMDPNNPPDTDEIYEEWEEEIMTSLSESLNEFAASFTRDDVDVEIDEEGITFSLNVVVYHSIEYGE